MTLAEIKRKPLKTLQLLATLKKCYKGGKSTVIKKSKADLVKALYRAYGDCKKISGNQYKNVKKKNITKSTSWKGSNQYKRKAWVGSSKRKFGIDVTGPKSITEINKKIRDKIEKSKTVSPIEKAVRESQFLYTLTFTPAWATDLRGKIQSVRRRTKTEYCRTVATANRRMKKLKINHIVFSKLCKR